jgi:uncharacterized protein (TIGR02145 family)
MKNTFKTMALCAALVAVAVTCKKEEVNKVALSPISNIAVTGVALNKTADMLLVGDTLTLTATVAPDTATNKAVAWASSDTAVAAVSSTGLVTAVAVGTATITATTMDGSKTATCAVTVVTPVPAPAGSMTLGGITWASVNVDDYQTFAPCPDMYTKFYQWNKRTAYSASDPLTPTWNSTLNTSATWTVNPCPNGWRLPTRAEFQALDIAGGGSDITNNDGSTWVEANAKGNAVAGRFYGPNHATASLPNSMAGAIFMPAVGYRYYDRDYPYFSEGALVSQGGFGRYWSSTQNGSNVNYSYISHFNSGVSNQRGDTYKANGYTLRCVR